MILKKYDLKSITEYMNELIKDIKQKTNSKINVVVVIESTAPTGKYLGVLGTTPNDIEFLLTAALEGIQQHEGNIVHQSDLSEYLDGMIE